MKIGSRLKL